MYPDMLTLITKSNDLSCLINPKKFMRTFDKYVKTQIPLLEKKNSCINVFENDDILFIDGLLTGEWCDDVISRTDPHYESISDEYPKKSRDVERFLAIDHGLAESLWVMIADNFMDFFKRAISPINAQTNRPNIPFGFGVKGKWRPVRINECFRFNRYVGPSIGFEPHRDSLYVESFNNRSIYTILIYLNDIQEDNHGETIFINSSIPKKDQYITVQEEMNHQHEITSFIKPKKGLIAIMAHNRIHKANHVNVKKYVIRSDIIFECYERPESYSPDLWRDSELFHNAVGFYNDAKRYEMAGDVKKASESYDKGLAIRQATYV